MAAQEKSTKEKDGLKGLVHTVKIEYFVLSEVTGIEQPRYGATIYTYDIEGYKTKEDHLMMDGTLSRQLVFTYDAKMRIAEEADYLGNGSLREKIIYTYDTYNKTAEAAVHGPDGFFSYKVIFKFDLGYDLGELAGLQGINRFYRESRWMEAAQYDSGGILLRRYTAVKNGGGRKIILRALNEDQRINASELEYIYDTKGNLIDRYLIINHTRIALSKDKNKAGLERSPAYKFDSKGNWIRKVFLSNGETQVEYRTITYY
jgi:hypothetical protein